MSFSSQRSLMDKFNLNIDLLDYKYIESCVDVKRLEKILKVLRSGEEGLFPHLISFCEQKLSEKDPENALLKKENMIKRYADLPVTERMQIQQEIKEWSSPASYVEEKCERELIQVENDLPPIREQWKLTKESNENREKSNGEKGKISKPRDYKDWDRFNVDEELQKIDNEKTQSEKTRTSLNAITELCDKISVNGLSVSECEHISNLENTKGNEAFKAKEYEEAVTYYSRSLSVHKTTKTLNNRAQAYIKLKNYKAAVKDCIEVLNLEPDNIKAIYRRGLAHKEAGLYDLAAIDFYLVLGIDPDCQAAQNQLQQMENEKGNKNTEAKILIEELDSSDNEIGTALDEKKSFNEDETATKITIEEIESSENRKHIMLDDLCHFNEEQNEDRPLPQKVKNMFLITQNKESTPKELPQTPDKRTKYCSNLQVIKSCNAEEFTGDKTKTNVLNSIEETTDKIKSFDLKVLDDSVQDFKKGSCEEATENSNSSNAVRSFKDNILLHTNENKTVKSTEISNEVGNFDKRNVPGPTEKSKEQNVETKVTPFEFINMWSQENAYKDNEAGADILLRIKPEELPKFLTYKLDSQLLISLLKAIGKLDIKDEYSLSVKYLNNLIKTPRIGTIALLLTKSEKEYIHNLFSIMEEKDKGSILQARNILN
ncbi:sperm-associated antigen 1 [Parasteatoda tepidariorum]|uniref:sperm-associated antigen 1 n=1 Tax=Parasteatoda tepidariorum TaxID=114398 RepID=UPI001C7238AD|nr:sperm-associated antigen 1 [Parasteatoda tepidariorum]